jgi:hypothetical protein
LIFLGILYFYQKRGFLIRPTEVRAERIRATREYLDLLEEKERELVGAPHEASVSKPVIAAGDVRLVKWPLPDAVPVFLETCDEPQTAKQIVDGLKGAGRDFESDKPVRAVRAALKKAMAANHDVYAIGWAKYFLRSKSTRKTRQIEKAFAKTNGTGGRSTKEHGRRTSEGIAKRRSGGDTAWGPKKKATPELLEQAREMLRTGSTLKDVCRTLKVSTPLLYENGIHALELRKEGRLRKEAQLALGDQTDGDNVVKFAKS